MTDSKANNTITWQNLDWGKKVQICQQDITKEDSLLISYVVIFVALEAIFAAVVISSLLSPGFDRAIAALGMALAVNFMLVCKRRSDLIDRRGAILYTLWKELPADEVLAKLEGKASIKVKDILEENEGCRERLKGGWKAIICGWPPCCKGLKFFFKSARRLTIIFCPILVITMWAFILCQI